jgi:hypothetical protein
VPGFEVADLQAAHDRPAERINVAQLADNEGNLVTLAQTYGWGPVRDLASSPEESRSVTAAGVVRVPLCASMPRSLPPTVR